MDKASSIAGTNSFSAMLTGADFKVKKGGEEVFGKKKNDDLKKLDEEMVKDKPTLKGAAIYIPAKEEDGSNVSDDKKEATLSDLVLDRS